MLTQLAGAQWRRLVQRFGDVRLVRLTLGIPKCPLRLWIIFIPPRQSAAEYKYNKICWCWYRALVLCLHSSFVWIFFFVVVVQQHEVPGHLPLVILFQPERCKTKPCAAQFQTLGSNTDHALQDGDCCGGAVLETCAKNLQELRRAGQTRLLQQHKVSPNHQRLHGAGRRPYRNRWVHHVHFCVLLICVSCVRASESFLYRSTQFGTNCGSNSLQLVHKQAYKSTFSSSDE